MSSSPTITSVGQVMAGKKGVESGRSAIAIRSPMIPDMGL